MNLIPTSLKQAKFSSSFGQFQSWYFPLPLFTGLFSGVWNGEDACVNKQGSPEKQNQHDTKEVYYEELAQMTMEAKKSHNLLSVTWRPRKASSVFQSKFKGFRTRGSNDVHPSPKAGEDEVRCHSSSNEARKKGWVPLSSALCSVQALNRLSNAHLHWRGQFTLLRPLIEIPVSSTNILTDTLRNSVSSGHPMAHSG